ncbi:hypothetical protein M8C21_011528, partial [Ambrosia artemisiifolia]
RLAMMLAYTTWKSIVMALMLCNRTTSRYAPEPLDYVNRCVLKAFSSKYIAIISRHFSRIGEGRQGAYDDEKVAAHAYDLAAFQKTICMHQWLEPRGCFLLDWWLAMMLALMLKSIVMAASKGRWILIVPLPKAAKKNASPGRGGGQTRAVANVVPSPPDPDQEEPVNPLLPLS